MTISMHLITNPRLFNCSTVDKSSSYTGHLKNLLCYTVLLVYRYPWLHYTKALPRLAAAENFDGPLIEPLGELAKLNLTACDMLAICSLEAGDGYL